MLTILFGENDFAIAQAKRQTIDAYLEETGSDIGLEKFDSSVDPASLWQSITAQPFLVSHKLVIVSYPSEVSALTEFLLDKFDEIPDTTHLLIIEGKLDKRTQYYKVLKKHPDAAEMNLLREAELSKWLADIASKAGVKLNNKQLLLVIERAGTDQWRLSNELQKLVALDKVTDEDINSLIEQNPTDTVFNMLDALAAGNKQHAYELYESLRRQRTEPQIILSMLSWQLQNISLVTTSEDRSDQQIAKDAGMNPYVVSKTRSTARKLDSVSLKSAIKLLADAEESSKTGKTDIDETLRLLILKLAKLF